MKTPAPPDAGGAGLGARAHLDRAIEILARLSFGRYDISVDLDTVDAEFVDLFAGLVILASDLREARDELAESNRELESQVRERTEQLEADIRKREAAEAALQASESMYRSLVETSPDPIVLCDSEKRISMANRAFLDVFCFASRDLVVGRALLSLVVPSDRNRGTQHWHKLTRAAAVRTSEFDFLRDDGSQFPGELRSTLVATGLSDDDSVLSVIRDLTETRRRDDELLRAAKLQSLGTLAGGIAHDFNNALAAITGTVFLAAERVRHDPETHSLLLEAIDAAFRSTGLTKQLLTFSMGGTPVKQRAHTAVLVRRVVEFCLRGSPVAWRLELAGDLWPIEVDEAQFEQALSNLLINAKQAMLDGGDLEIRVENVLTADPADADAGALRYVRISIRDTGVGIAPENMRRIFDPYFSTKASGSGLGLATAYSVVKKHGGFLRCVSTPGKGSTFSIHLPASDRSPQLTKACSPSPALGSGRILVMDDDARVCDLTQKLLQQAGYETVGVSTGSAAVACYAQAKAEGSRFAAVIMDLTVPGGDGGKEAIGRLLELDGDVRAIVASGYSDDPVLSDFRSYGFVGMLSKPFRFQELIHIVQAALSGPSPRRQSPA